MMTKPPPTAPAAAGMPQESNEARSRRFNDTTGALSWNRRSAVLHPDRCACQDEATPHKHYSDAPFACARCACTAYQAAAPIPPVEVPREPQAGDSLRLKLLTDLAESIMEDFHCDSDICEGEPASCACGGDECWRCAAAQALTPPPWLRAASASPPREEPPSECACLECKHCEMTVGAGEYLCAYCIEYGHEPSAAPVSQGEAQREATYFERLQAAAAMEQDMMGSTAPAPPVPPEGVTGTPRCDFRWKDGTPCANSGAPVPSMGRVLCDPHLMELAVDAAAPAVQGQGGAEGETFYGWWNSVDVEVADKDDARYTELVAKAAWERAFIAGRSDRDAAVARARVEELREVITLLDGLWPIPIEGQGWNVTERVKAFELRRQLTSATDVLRARLAATGTAEPKGKP